MNAEAATLKFNEVFIVVKIKEKRVDVSAHAPGELDDFHNVGVLKAQGAEELCREIQVPEAGQILEAEASEFEDERVVEWAEGDVHCAEEGVSVDANEVVEAWLREVTFFRGVP
ncbi:hypothetical protein BgiMline_021798 [Biomphalaria glabrata]|nr:hypothetical protein BgiBS90_030775 [Biomphalaria glabrata]